MVDIKNFLEDGIFPFNTLDKKYGSVANAMREMGFEVLKHPSPGAHKGSHYLVVNPEVINILEEPLIAVINEDNNPPVQDSATAKVSFFFFNRFTKFLAILLIEVSRFYQS